MKITDKKTKNDYIEEHLLTIGNVSGKEVVYNCIQCNKEKLKYFTTLDDTETHYTRCYKCILADTDLTEYFRLKTAYKGE